MPVGGEVVGPGIQGNAAAGLVTSVNGQTALNGGVNGALISAVSAAIQIAASGVGGSVRISTAGGGTITLDAGSGGTPGGLLLIADGNGGIQMFDNGSGADVLVLPNLPVADPHTVGQLWNSAGTLKVSAG